jgi:tetratricopeptide (TPR) repeat protein
MALSMTRAGAESRTTAGKWLLAGVIPWSALALGSIPTEVLVITSIAAATACGLLWMDRAVEYPAASRLILAALLLLLGITVLQAVPLPSSVTHLVSPANADIWDRALSPLREPGPAWHPISVAPPATRVEVLRGFFYGCVFLGALRVAALEDGKQFLLRVIVFSTVAMALSALAHNAVGAEKVFGIYRPRELYAYQAGRFAPLLNTNHLAAYLNIGACVSLGLLLTRRVMPRALSGSAMLVLAATSVWQSSRGAAATLFFGIIVVFGLTLYTKRSLGNSRRGALILAGCAVAATLVVTVALSEARTHLLSRDLTKLTVAKSSLRLVFASPWLGAGRGAFETVFSSVREGVNYITFTNPEDIFVQWFVEWGVPASIAGLALLGWALRPQMVLRAVRPQIGAWVAIVASVLHEIADYHFEVPGIVALAAVCAAVAVSSSPTNRIARDRKVPQWARLPALALALGTVVAAACALPDVSHSLAEERRALAASAVEKTISPAVFGELVRASLLRYPAEPFLPLMGAVRAQTFGEGSVVPWVARALERNPRFGRAHFVLARSLSGSRAAQARLEYRLAYEYDVGLRSAVVAEAPRVIVDVTSALELVPEGEAGIAMLEALVPALAERLPSTAVALDAELARRTPDATPSLRRRAQAAASDAIDHAPWCAGNSACLDDAVAATDELIRREPSKCESHVLRARLRIAKGETGPALDALNEATNTVSDPAACKRELIQLAFRVGDNARADAALDQLVRAGCGTAVQCVDIYSWAGSVEESRGHYVKAVRLYRRVLDFDANREDMLQRIGALGAHGGLLADALDAYATLAARHPEDPQWPARIAELRSRFARPSPLMRFDAGLP